MSSPSRDVVSGGVVEVGRLVYNGNEVAAGSYTSAEPKFLS